MSLLRRLDPAFPIDRQIGIDAGPVVLVNVFTLDKADEETFLKVWQDDAAFMKRQPGSFRPSFTERLAKAQPISTMRSGNRTRPSGRPSLTRSSGQSFRHIRLRPSLPRTCSKRSRSQTSASHSHSRARKQRP